MLTLEKTEQERQTTGAQLAEEVRQHLAEEMRRAIAEQNWGQLTQMIDAYSRMVK